MTVLNASNNISFGASIIRILSDSLNDIQNMLRCNGGPERKKIESLSYCFLVRSAETRTCHPFAARPCRTCKTSLLAQIASEPDPYPKYHIQHSLRGVKLLGHFHWWS
jgi:hypothetical protein